MKKRYLYIIATLVLAGILSFTIIRYQHKQKDTFYTIKDRKGPAAQTPEWISTKRTAVDLQNQVVLHPEDNKARLSLASLFIQEARVTGDYSYYDRAAMKQVNQVLTTDSVNFEALLYKSLLFLSQHHFADGLEYATKAQQINPYNAFVYGMLIDANVELGNYTAAVQNSDKMVSIRPDIRSYSRISYLREIHGDNPGAIEAMKLAVEAGVPGTEPTEWARIQLAQLYEHAGDLRSAEMHYTIALEQRPGYAYALAGMGRIAMSNKDYPKAAELFTQANAALNDNSFKEELIEVNQLMGQKEKATELTNGLIDNMSKEAKSGQEDESIGHYADRELAYAYIDAGNYDKALEHALAEYNRRPANIDVNETLAWVYYQQKQYAKALPYIKEALKTNSKNPGLLCHAGLISLQAGDKATAKNLLGEALKNKSYISPVLHHAAEEAYKTAQQ
jgi:tetratricopeptide (TPR) repeat protein